MPVIKLIILTFILSASACRAGETASVPSQMEVAATVESPVISPLPSAPRAKETELASPEARLESRKKPSVPLLRWQFDRYSLQLEKGEAVEIKDKPGRLVCEITEGGVRKVLGKGRLKELKAAIATLALAKGSYARNPIFRPYDESRELLAIVKGEELLVELMYQAQEVLVPLSQAEVEAFDDAFRVVMSAARETKLCPTLSE